MNLKFSIFLELFEEFGFKECSDVCRLNSLTKPPKPDKWQADNHMIPGNILSHNFTRLKMDSVEYVKSHMVCGKESENGRKPTKFKLMGHWILAPDNPGLYARYYGAEYLKHVPQKDWWSQKWGAQKVMYSHLSPKGAKGLNHDFESILNIKVGTIKFMI